MLKSANFKPSRNQLENMGVATAGSGFTEQPQVPDQLCTKCPGCGKTIFTSDMRANLWMCPSCGYHFKYPARKHLLKICDENSFEEWDTGLRSTDFLHFPGYAVKLKSARLNSRENESVISGKAAIEGEPCAIFAMDSRFMMGSMGSVVGEKITRLFERATEERLPVIGFTLSGGARMQEGTTSLMQMAKTSGAVKYHSDAGLLYITVLTNPTTGGVTASFAMEGRYPLIRARRADRFCRPARDRADHAAKTAQGFPKRGVPARKRILRRHCVAPGTAQSARAAAASAQEGGVKRWKLISASSFQENPAARPA